ncbi:MAG: CaiB/BaiF CoA transferase family protein [Hyphomicrobiaceae bacterium]
MKLAGVKVLDLSQFLPGPHLTMMMADHGAEVIKIEPYQGGEPARHIGLSKGGHSVWFRNTNRGKRSLRLNLKDPRGKEVLHRLCGCADVFVESFRPGVMQRLGFDYATLVKRSPRLVYCSISAFGQDGRYRDKPAHDLSVEAMAGLISVSLGQDGKPAIPAIPAADMAASLMALSGILMALLKQRETGRGDFIDIAMHDALLAWTPNVMGPVFAEGRPPVPKDERSWGGAAFYNIYETADGQFITLGGSEHKFAENFLAKAGRPDLALLCREAPGAKQAPVREYLGNLFRSRTLADWLAWLDGVDVCYAPVRTLKDAIDDPNAVERGMLLRDERGLEHLGVPIKFAHEPATPDLRVPELGEDSEAILREIGLDGDIGTLRREGVI